MDQARPTELESHIAYRPDIDGLRAVAVLSVLSFHTFPALARGGFVGVDVFFVISGYLISSIIVGGLATDRFSLRQFYARRIRRIFPALLLVLAACLVFGWMALLVDEYTQLAKHAAAAAGFSLNFVLWGEAGYFDRAAALKPLLHLWSLGVEEQFYIVWPALLWLAWQRRINLLVLTLAIVAVSFWLDVRTTGTNAVAAFYSPITRLWELLFGCFLALPGTSLSAAPGEHASMREHLKAFLGVLLIAAAVVRLNGSAAYPGWRALLPTTGAFLIISAGPRAWFNRQVLSHPVLIWIGLISYPLYLWHWPLLSFARLVGPPTPSWAVRSSLALASIVLAWLTYQFIERPTRRSRSAATVGVLVTLMLVVGVTGAYTFSNDELDAARVPPSLRPYSNFKYTPGVNARPGHCWLDASQPFTEYGEDCVDGVDGNGPLKPLVFVWGDSHAARLYAGMSEVLRNRYRFAQFTRDSCPPLLGSGPQRCLEGNRFVLGKIQQTRPEVVVLFASWKEYSPNWDAQSPPTKELLETIAAVADTKPATLIVVGPAPGWTKPLPKLVYEAAARDVPLHRVPQRIRAGLDRTYFGLDSALRQRLAGQPITYFSIRDVMCDGNGCLTHVADGADQIVSFDDGHFTTAGAAYVARRLLP